VARIPRPFYTDKRSRGKQFRVNEAIRAREVRVIGESGEQLGIVPITKALELAREREVDLVEVAPTAEPPVCRLLDFGQFKFEQSMKEREARRKQKTVSLRQVRFRPKIGRPDLEAKIRTVRKLLEKGNKVQLFVLFRGREITHPHLGRELLEQVAETVGDMASVERPAAMEGRRMTLLLTPDKRPKKQPE